MKLPEFISFVNDLIDQYTSSELPEVWRAHMMQVKRGNMQAIELFYKMKGLIPESKVKVNQEVTGKNGGPIEVINYNYLSDEELENELRKYEARVKP